MKGWVYIITTKAMPGLVKVGFSTKDPELRALELNNTGNPYPYKVEYDVLVHGPRNVEQAAHSLLKNYHENKEWFNCSIETAILAIRKASNGGVILENCQVAVKHKNHGKAEFMSNFEAYKHYLANKSNTARTVIQNESTDSKILSESYQDPVKEFPCTLEPVFSVKEGIATNMKTGLMWLRFAHGQVWQDNTTIGNPKKVNWEQAFDVAREFNQQGGYAGYSDWRLPSNNELKTLIDKIKGVHNNYIDTDVFPNNSQSFWSCSDIAGGSCHAYTVNFYVGDNFWLPKSDYCFVRLVRSSK